MKKLYRGYSANNFLKLNRKKSTHYSSNLTSAKVESLFHFYTDEIRIASQDGQFISEYALHDTQRILNLSLRKDRTILAPYISELLQIDLQNRITILSDLVQVKPQKKEFDNTALSILKNQFQQDSFLSTHKFLTNYFNKNTLAFNTNFGEVLKKGIIMAGYNGFCFRESSSLTFGLIKKLPIIQESYQAQIDLAKKCKAVIPQKLTFRNKVAEQIFTNHITANLLESNESKAIWELADEESNHLKITIYKDNDYFIEKIIINGSAICTY